MSWIGVDLGGTNVQGALVEIDGDEVSVVADAKSKTPSGGPAEVVDAIAGVVDRLRRDGDVEGVGIGAPGAIDQGAGAVLRAPNLGWETTVPLVELVRAQLDGVEVVLDNDVNVGTLGEQRAGAGRGVDDLLGVFWGTGVGGGLVLDGVLRRGPTGTAGEIGHTVVVAGGRRCGCGRHGHVEAYAGRACMEAEARRRHAAGEETLLVELAGDGRMKSSVLAKALDGGDAVAVELLDEAVAVLGSGIASAVALLDVDLVVLGGGVADRLGPAIVGRVEQAVRTELFVTTSTLRVVPAALGDLGGAIGAALLAATPG